MSSSSKSGSRRNSGAKPQKSSKEKKTRTKKPKTGAKYLTKEESAEPTLQEIAEKTVASIERLGSQTFALAPFSQYYDDWLVSLRQVVSEFEVSPTLKVDEAFTKEREAAFLEVQSALAEMRVQESDISDAEKALHDVNHELGDADADYAEKTRELGNKRNADVTRLTTRISTLEDVLSQQEGLKFGFFQFGAKKEAAKKLEETKKILNSAVVNEVISKQDKLSKQLVKKSDIVDKDVSHVIKFLQALHVYEAALDQQQDVKIVENVLSNERVNQRLDDLFSANISSSEELQTAFNRLINGSGETAVSDKTCPSTCPVISTGLDK